jgi:hypothetical protein
MVERGGLVAAFAAVSASGIARRFFKLGTSLERGPTSRYVQPTSGQL